MGIRELGRGDVDGDFDGEFYTDDPPDTGSGRAGRESHGAAEVVVIGECERRHPKCDRARHQVLGLRGAVEQGEHRVTVEFDVAHNLPVRCSRCVSIFRSWMSVLPRPSAIRVPAR